MSAGACAVCRDAGFVALAEAVAGDDLDRAMEHGLLSFEPPASGCDACAPRVASVRDARDARLRALAARERYRARQARLAERAEAKARRRAAAQPVVDQAVADQPKAAPALPSAALAALARAKARAAAKRSD